MNASPKYAVSKLATLPAVNAQAVGSLGSASGFMVSPYQSVAAASVDSDSPSKLHSLVLRRMIGTVGKKKQPSFTSVCNQLALRLASRIENRVRTVLLVSRRGARDRLRKSASITGLIRTNTPVCLNPDLKGGSSVSPEQPCLKSGNAVRGYSSSSNRKTLNGA